MADLKTVTCEVCQDRKGTANHWWAGYTLKDEYGRDAGALILPLQVEAVSWPFRKKLPKPSVHLCGMAHAQRWMDSQLDRAKNLKPWPSALEIIPGPPVIPLRLEIHAGPLTAKAG